MKSVPLLLVYPRGHKILFLYSFTSCILQWHWHIMMLIQPCTTPAPSIIKLSVSSLKQLRGISNQLSEWVLLPYIIHYSLSYSSTLYVYISESSKCRKNPESPTLLATNPTKQNMGCATVIYIFCDIIAIVVEVIIFWRKKETTLFLRDEYLLTTVYFQIWMYKRNLYVWAIIYCIYKVMPLNQAVILVGIYWWAKQWDQCIVER